MDTNGHEWVGWGVNFSFAVFGLAVLQEAIDGDADDLSEFSVLLEGQFFDACDLVL